MKKFFKTLAVGLFVVPCMLILTACGGNNTLDVSGNYTEIKDTAQIATTKAYLAENANEDVNTMSGSGFRMNVDMSGKVDGLDISTKLNCYAVTDENGLRMNFELVASQAGESMNMNMYADGEYMYTNMMGQKIKVAMPSDLNTIFGTEEMEEIVMTPSQFLTNLEEIENSVDFIKYSQSVNGDSNKIKIEYSAEAEGDVTIYFTFEKDVFTGMRMEAVANNTQANIRGYMEFALYEGAVNLPGDLNTYIDMSEIPEIPAV